MINLSKHNIFLNTMKDYKSSITRNEALFYLQQLQSTVFKCGHAYDIINYEKLIYIYVNFKDDDEIFSLINNLFEDIAIGWEIKDKIIKDM